MTGQQAQKFSELGLLYESYLSVCKTGRADPVTRLSRLAETLSQEDYCAGKRFYLAGFSDFTAVQLRILDAIFPQAVQTQVYLCTNGSDNAAFRCGAQTAKQLSRMAARRNIAVVREQVSERTCRPASLELWLSQIMNTGGTPFSEPAPGGGAGAGGHARGCVRIGSGHRAEADQNRCPVARDCGCLHGIRLCAGDQAHAAKSRHRRLLRRHDRYSRKAASAGGDVCHAGGKQVLV